MAVPEKRKSLLVWAGRIAAVLLAIGGLRDDVAGLGDLLQPLGAQVGRITGVVLLLAVFISLLPSDWHRSLWSRRPWKQGVPPKPGALTPRTDPVLGAKCLEVARDIERFQPTRQLIPMPEFEPGKSLLEESVEVSQAALHGHMNRKLRQEEADFEFLARYQHLGFAARAFAALQALRANGYISDGEVNDYNGVNDYGDRTPDDLERLRTFLHEWGLRLEGREQ